MIETFMWGYWGWGGSTKELVKALDDAEGLRGYAPPVFVDIRVRREVRAVGFRGDAFERRLGPKRHRWMRGLGNQGVIDRGKMRLGDETQVRDLLDLVVESYASKRRVIFFCACRWPRRDGDRSCHRDLVAELLVKEARRREVDLSVVEWPGGAPRHLLAMFPPEAARAALGEAQTVPIPPGMSPDIATAVPWGSYALVKQRDGAVQVPIIVGPAVHAQGRWALRLPWFIPEGASSERSLRRGIMALRKGWGYEPRYAQLSTRVNETPWKDLIVRSRII